MTSREAGECHLFMPAARQDGLADGRRTPAGDGGDAGRWQYGPAAGGDTEGALPSPLALSSSTPLVGDREQLFPVPAAAMLAQLNLAGTGESARESAELQADAERCLTVLESRPATTTPVPLASCVLVQCEELLATELTTCCCCCSPAFWICRHLARRFLNQTYVTYNLHHIGATTTTMETGDPNF